MAVVHWDGGQWGRSGAGGILPGPSDADWDNIGPLIATLNGPNGNDRYFTDKASSFSPLKKTFAPKGTVVLGFWWQAPGTPATDVIVKFWDGATVQCQLEAEPVAGKFTLRLRNGTAGAIQATSNTQFTVGPWRWVTVKIPFGNSVTVSCKVDAVTEFTVAGADTRNSAADQCDAIEIMTLATGNATRLTTIVTCDTASGVMNDLLPPQRSAVQYPTGADAGTFNDFTASSGTRTSTVDEPASTVTNPNDDTDYVSSGTVGHKQSFPLTSVPVGVINAYRVSWRVKRDDAAARQARAFIRNAAGTIHNFGTRNVPGSYETFTEELLLSPFTGVAFTKTEVDGFQLGVEVMA